MRMIRINKWLQINTLGKIVTTLTLLLFVVVVFAIGAWSVWHFGTSTVRSESLLAQAGGAIGRVSCTELGKNTDIPLPKRAEDLTACLEGLSVRINAITKKPIPPTAPVRLMGTGEAENDTRITIGVVSEQTPSLDVTLRMENRSGESVRFSNLIDGGTGKPLGAPFRFKGGAAPGIGGTCGPLGALWKDNTSCTLVLSFSPTSETPPDGRIGSHIRYMNTAVKVYYLSADGEEGLDYLSNPLALTGYRKEELRAASDPITDMVVRIDTASISTLPGEVKILRLSVGLKDTNDQRPLIFSDVSASGITAPFFLSRNGCNERAALDVRVCDIEIEFRPTVAGSFTRAVAVSVKDSAGVRRELAPVTLTGAALAKNEDLVPDKNLLVVYNADWSESVEAKNYYVANRPGFERVNTLGVHFPVTPKCSGLSCLSEALEIALYSEIRSRILNPIISWLREHPEKDIQYIVLMRGLPTRPGGGDTSAVVFTPGDPVKSLQALIRDVVAQNLQREVFASSLDIGSVGATKAYIDKLKSVYALMPVKSPVISARGTSKGGTTYYFSDAILEWSTRNDLAAIVKAPSFSSAVRAVAPSAQIVTKEPSDPLLASASDVTGFLVHGAYAYGERQPNGTWTNGDYAVNGSVNFTGKSGWYAITTLESFNGLWMGSGWQGNFIQWFSAHAFGGTNYSNTPAAALTHVIEPSSIAQKPSLFACWEGGKPFAYCAWRADNSAYAAQVVGDPWVTR